MCRNLLERDLVDRLQIAAKFILLFFLFLQPVSRPRS